MAQILGEQPYGVHYGKLNNGLSYYVRSNSKPRMRAARAVKVGDIVQQCDYPNIGATELILSNGMRVCYKCKDFLDDQVMFTGFSYGDLSEIPESNYVSCSI